MNIICDQLDEIETNDANSQRLPEESDVISVVMAQYSGTISFSMFEAGMRTSLWSLVPKDCDSDQEVSWGHGVDFGRTLSVREKLAGVVQENAEDRLIMSLTEDAVNYQCRRSTEILGACSSWTITIPSNQAQLLVHK